MRAWELWVLVGVDVVAFTVVGWPADALARKPGGRAGIAWLAVTFCFPAMVWAVIGSVRGSDYDSGGLLYFLGYLVSVAAIFGGTLVSRVVHNARSAAR